MNYADALAAIATEDKQRFHAVFNHGLHLFADLCKLDFPEAADALTQTEPDELRIIILALVLNAMGQSESDRRAELHARTRTHVEYLLARRAGDGSDAAT